MTRSWKNIYLIFAKDFFLKKCRDTNLFLGKLFFCLEEKYKEWDVQLYKWKANNHFLLKAMK